MSAEPPASCRYAVYAVPERDSPLWRLGRQWLGRCAESGAAVAFAADGAPPPDGWAHWVREPRRYGWHATLKAPFRLRDGASLADLRASLRTLAARWSPLPRHRLRVTCLGHFLALCPEDGRAGQAAAQACVQELDALAATLTAQELAYRRGKSALTPREDALLQRWGYPYVMERYRFHYSLTGSLSQLPDTSRQAIRQAASARFDALAPQSLGTIALFTEPEPGADFQLLERF